MLDPIAARRFILDQHVDWGTETIPLAQAPHRILARHLTADRDQPPFDRVAMDGIAFDHRAYAHGQREFPVSHFAPAGAPPKARTDTGQCVEVMTGAPLPPGCTTVVRYEDLTEGHERFTVPEGIPDGQSIHRRGKDGRAGEEVAAAGMRIGPALMAALATFGYAKVEVKRWPRVAIASTGDEVVAVDRQPEAHQIRSSNVHQLAALFRAWGIEPTLGHLPDDKVEGRKRLDDHLDQHDLILLSGGVSKGKLDHIPDWLRQAGVDCLFHRVAQRPGKPLWVGRREDTMVFALPGNPVSSLVGAVAYVGPFLRHALGCERRESQAVLAEDVTFGPELQLFQSVRLETRNGQRIAHPISTSGSGDLVSLIATDGFLVLPRGRSDFPAGEAFPFLPISLF
jgi:molybdopterin molybdotransferase